MTADNLKTIRAGESYYAGGTTSKVAGKDVKPSEPMVDGQFVPEAKPKVKVYKGGSQPVYVDRDLLVEHYDYSN